MVECWCLGKSLVDSNTRKERRRGGVVIADVKRFPCHFVFSTEVAASHVQNHTVILENQGTGGIVCLGHCEQLEDEGVFLFGRRNLIQRTFLCFGTRHERHVPLAAIKRNALATQQQHNLTVSVLTFLASVSNHSFSFRLSYY